MTRSEQPDSGSGRSGEHRRATSAARAGRWPDFLLVGAAKAGTSTLYHHLRRHPGIFMPELKEPWFFAYAGEPESAAAARPRTPIPTTVQEYLDLFVPARADQIVGEASTVYLYQYDRTIRNICSLHPSWRQLRILILLRDPVARAHSHYMNDVRDGRAEEPLSSLIDRWRRDEVPMLRNYYRYGLYSAQVAAYLERFPNVRVHLFDDLEQRPEEVVRDCFEFLRVPADVGVDAGLRTNPSGTPRSTRLLSLVTRPNLLKRLVKPVLSASVRAKAKAWAIRNLVRKNDLDDAVAARLRPLFREDVQRLERIIGRDLSRWLA